MDTNYPRVLIAEDNPALLRVTMFAIERAGFDVETAVDGAEALKKLQEGEFGLLITDQQMPKMTGVELIRALREMPQYAETPIILLTAKALELNHEQMVEEYGVAQVLGKPFSPLQISRLVQDLMPVAV